VVEREALAWSVFAGCVFGNLIFGEGMLLDYLMNRFRESCPEMKQGS
jgi:hypothetical protein